MNLSSITWKWRGLLVGLMLHAGVYALVVHPIQYEHGIHSYGPRYAIAAIVAYFPASLIAVLAVVYANTYAHGEFDGKTLFTTIILIVGALWYGLIGYGVGRWVDRRAKAKRAVDGQQVGAANGSQPVRSETNRTSSAAGSRR
jgi:uncharacterized membrane protein YdjX (TVP38/TMEM64 family)